MATSRTAWGIDVGNRALKAVRVSRDGDGYRIDDFDVIEHETPLSQSGDNRDSLIATALTQFVQRHKISTAIPVGVAVSGQQSFARFVKLPPVEESKIPEIVRFEAVQQIPFPLDDVEFDWQLFRKADDPDIEVGLFAMRKELVNRHVEAYTNVKLNVQVVQMSPMAVYNAMAFDGRLNDGTTLIIDMGADTTDLVVADGEQIWHRSIPIGGNNFTETLVRGFKVDQAKAEGLKREASTSKYARQIFQAMRPVFADLVAEIQRSVGFYASTHRDAKLKKAIAIGGTFKLPGLQKYLQQNLQLDVERLESFTAAAPQDQRLLALYQDNVLSAATAYGLAVQAMGEAKVTSSLLPSHIQREKVWREKTKWFAASAALFVAAAGISVAGAYLPKVQYEAAADERTKIQTAMDQANALDSEWAKVESAGEADRSVIRNILTLSADRTFWSSLASTIRNALPETPTDVAALKAVPRAQRKSIQIDGWDSQYVTDVGPLLADPTRGRFMSAVPVATSTNTGGEFGGEAPPAAPSFMPPGLGARGASGLGLRGPTGSAGAESQLQLADVPKDVVTAATGKTGFLLRVTGITPNQAATSLLGDTFLKELLKTRYAPDGVKQEFYIADAFLVRQDTVRNDPTRLQDMVRAYTEAQKLKPPVPQEAGANPLTPQALLPDDPTPYLDPVTGEDVRNDKVFSLLVFVVVGQPPVPPAATTP